MTIPTTIEVIEADMVSAECLIKVRLATLEQTFKDVQAELVGGYSSRWESTVTDPALDRRPRINQSISSELHKLSIEFVSLSRIMLQYETIIRSAMLLDIDARNKKG